MARIETLVVLVNLLICAYANKSSITTSSTVPAPTPTPRPLPNPSPSPTKPPPHKEGNKTFISYDDKGEVCTILTADLTIDYTYNNASNKSQVLTLSEPLDGLLHFDEDASMCDSSRSVLTLFWNFYDETADVRYITFIFTANNNKGSKHWTFDKVIVNVTASAADFPDHSGSGNTLFYNHSGFFDDKIEFERAYRCNASQTFGLKNAVADQSITASITVKDFQVQAFVFKNPGQFGNIRKCSLDSGDGSKIVPIAVGVALAVLIIAVIIAFIISKVVNRRKSSYEALN